MMKNDKSVSMTAKFSMNFENRPVLNPGEATFLSLVAFITFTIYLVSILHAKKKIDVFKLCRKKVLTPEEIAAKKHLE